MATDAVAAEGVAGQEQILSRTYRASWLDAIVARIERLPAPLWVVYLALAGVAAVINVLEAALSSRGLFGQDVAYFGYFALQVVPLAAYHFLSRGAGKAWEAFRPATNYDDATAARWRMQLSTTRTRPALAIYIASVVGYMAGLAVYREGFDLVGHQPAFVALRVISEAFWMAPVAWMVVYLLFRQARIVAHLHKSVVRVDLLRPGPLHAMSTLTARSAIVLLFLQLVPFVPLPNLSEDVRLLVRLVVAPFLLVPIAAFFLPLRGMHARLEQEKARRLADASSRIDSAVSALHREVDEATVSPRDAETSRIAQLRLDALNKGLASLLQEREFFAKLSTWPWDPSTLRAVVSALALPLVLFLLTRVLERFVL